MEPDPIAFVGQVARASPYAWAGLATMLASVYCLAWLVTWLGMRVALRLWRQYRGDFWPEAARLAWPVRRLGRMSLIVVMIPLLIVVRRDSWHAEILPPIVTNSLAFTAAWLGQIQGTISWGRKVNPAWALTPRAARGGWALSLSTIGPIVLAGFLVYGLGRGRGPVATFAIIVAETIALGAFFAWGWSSLMRWTGIIRTASDRLQSIATQVGEFFVFRPREVVEVALPMANAFAFIQSGTLGVTDAALATLDDDELAAVCVHEMAHLTEPRWVRAIRLSFWFFFGLGLGLPIAAPLVHQPLRHNLEWLVLLSGPVLILWALIVHAHLGRRMEIRADAAVRRLESAPGTYARALERIYAANLIPVVHGMKRQTHPELYDRLVAAGAPPPYPRPSAPSRERFYRGLLIEIIVAIVGILGLICLAVPLPNLVLDPQSAASWTIGAVGGTFDEACLLARAAHDRGDGPSELEFYRAAWALDASRDYAPAMLAGRLADQGRCAEARAYWAEAQLQESHLRKHGTDSASDDAAVAWARLQLTNQCGGTGSPEVSEVEVDAE
jgi:Zn-dependent protease with chaperone function